MRLPFASLSGLGINFSLYFMPLRYHFSFRTVRKTAQEARLFILHMGTNLQQKEGAFLQAKGYFKKSDVSKLSSLFIQT